jgi:hypothetical protein
MGAMVDVNDYAELATELARIASETTDLNTGLRLMDIVHRLLTEAGLPEADEGGGETPTGWLSEPMFGCA